MTDVPDEVRALAAERDRRRAEKDFAAADALRDRIAGLGFTVVDAPEGPKLEPIRPPATRRVRAAEVPSVLEQPSDLEVSVHWVVEGWPEDVVRAISGFRGAESGRRVQYVVADVTETDPRPTATASRSLRWRPGPAGVPPGTRDCGAHGVGPSS